MGEVLPRVSGMSQPPPPGTVGLPATTAYAPRRPAAGRIFGRLVVTAVAIASSLFLGLIAFGQWLDNTVTPAYSSPWAVLGLLATLGTAVLLGFRRHIPVSVTLICAAAALLLPTSALPAAIGIHGVLARRGGPVAWWSVAAVYAASVSAVYKDVFAPESLLAGMTGATNGVTPEGSLLPFFAPLIAAALLAPFVGIGFARGALGQRDRAARQNAQLAHSTEVLHDQVARDRERQAAAREIHDTLASRLSALSLNAGALELAVTDEDSESARAARAVRESAQRSLDDLRHVVQVLRNPEASADAGKTLTDLRQLVDEAHSVGDPVRSSVMVDAPGSCPPDVAHAAYRVVQEALSNARRHAPGAAVIVNVHGGPSEGLTVRVVNGPTRGAPNEDAGTGHGVLGMRERILLVGGEFDAAPTTDGGFQVTARIPWR